MDYSRRKSVAIFVATQMATRNRLILHKKMAKNESLRGVGGYLFIFFPPYIIENRKTAFLFNVFNGLRVAKRVATLLATFLSHCVRKG